MPLFPDVTVGILRAGVYGMFTVNNLRVKKTKQFQSCLGKFGGRINQNSNLKEIIDCLPECVRRINVVLLRHVSSIRY